ncbi:SusC/RagA family TonB-linked outer membrane protein [Sphingobacterium sp. HMA12]|uniref:SusC/RagA family TonB-linked outer membrane protein n=1 Tax=Sphingobacterium sp. HMA12 TaxID=2050894 RepID=UPI0018F85384|nr:SusC/RagA family TonB-linked outer membrane protein [Sphingobacterium sp. HMA12]
MIKHLLTSKVPYRYYALLMMLGASSIAFAQQKNYTIKGKVTDSRTGQSVPGTTIKLKGTNQTVSTNANGEFTLTTSINPGKYDLLLSNVGYAPNTTSIELGNQTTLTLAPSLQEDLVRMNEVIVIGNAVGTSRKVLGNAVSTVNAKDIANSNATSIDQALTGKVAGAQISQNSGNPAGGISVQLRGPSSIVGGGSPLYIVDGVIVNNSSAELLDLGGYSQNRLVDINPADIENIEIIKGAAAAAIYGSRASNGVVQITTKRGREGKPTFTFSTSLKTSSLRKKLPYNTYGKTFAKTDVADLSQIDVTRYDYQDKIFQTGIGTDNNISMSGGTAGTKYYISGTYLNNQGIIKNTDFTRGGLRARLDQDLNSWLKLGAGMNYVYSHSNEMPNGGMNEAYGALTGFIFSNNFINPERDPITGNYPSTTPVNIVKRTNPLEAINNFKFAQRTSRFIGNLSLQAKPLEGLTLNYILGFDNANSLGTAYIPPGNTTPSYEKGYAQRADITTFMLNNDFSASYQTKIGEWLESTSGAGVTFQTEKNMSTNLKATQMGYGGETIDNGVVVPKELRSDMNIFGAFFQQTFGIKEKIYLTGAIRYDMSSVFGSENRSQFYPKVSGSYVLSNEQFWQNSAINNVLSSFKIRASYGQSGNLTALSPFDRYTNYSPFNTGGINGIIPTDRMGNEGIKPERQEEFEIGTDLSMFRDRLGLEFSYYRKNVKDLLLDINLTPSTGYSVQYANIGTMTNRGMEFLLRGVPVLKENFKWNITAVYSHNKNVVNNVPGGILMYSAGFGQVAAVNGYPLGAFYATYFARNEDGSIYHNAAGLPTTAKVGKDNNGVPTGATLKKVIGDPNPDWTGSLINEINVGSKWTFRAQLDAVVGQDVFNFTRRVGDRDLYGGLAGYEPELRGEVPKGTSAALFSIMENWIEKGSFVKVREVSASYNWARPNSKIKNIRFSLAGRNLLSFDNYSGWDPEVNAAGQSNAVRGFDFVEVPLPRQVIAGVNLTF